MERRTFLTSITSACLGVLTAPRRVLAADVEIDVGVDAPGAVISPFLYGQFIEHLGGVIYDGIWVGARSPIRNVGGIRARFVEDMKRLGSTALRWPGGCFADGYHWRDGIGPASARKHSYNFWETRMPPGMHATESNVFGVHEFMRLCRLIGAEPYLAANIGSGTPREFHDWVSYCNAPTGTESLAAERAANGDADPFRVKYWGVGNESWGCGGDMTPAEYATEYRRFVTQLPAYGDAFLIAAGPRGHQRDMDLAWTSGFFEAMSGHRSPVHGYSPHFYSDFRSTKMRVADFTAPEWYAVLLEAFRTERVIATHWDLMQKWDPEHHTKLVIDEWGVWYPVGEEIAPGHIFSQPLTLRDALHTAITFDVFNRYAGNIEMANVAQTVNCLHSLFLALGDHYTRTPPYYVFEMYAPHKGARVVPMRIEAADMTVSVPQGTASLPSLSGSASLRGKRVTVTLTNPSLDAPVTARLRFGSGARATEGRGTVLTHGDMRARNTFEAPEEVRLAPLAVAVASNSVLVEIPKHAVAAFEIGLA